MRIGRTVGGGLQHHVDALAATARMEMDLDVGDWRATVAQLHELMDQMTAQSKTAQSETERLITMMRQRISRLEGIIWRREQEYDRLQEEVCAKVDDAHQAGYDEATEHYARGGSFK